MQLKDANENGKSGKVKKHVKRADDEGPPEAAKAATKIIRTVDQWMRQRDLEQALLRGSAISDIGFSTLVWHQIQTSGSKITDLSCMGWETKHKANIASH